MIRRISPLILENKSLLLAPRFNAPGFDWSAFEGLLSPIHGSAMGAPGYPRLTMFKIVLLQQWHTLSDPAAEEAVRDRLSFRRW
jgi:hypothetical protein